MIVQVVQYIVNVFLLFGIYSLIATSLGIIFGVLEVPNFAQGELYMLGAYVTYFALKFSHNFFLALVLSAVAVAAIGLVIERLSVSRFYGKGRLPMMVSTFGLSLLIQNLAIALWTAEWRFISLPFLTAINIGGVSVSTKRLLISIISISGMAITSFVVYRTKLGKAMRAVSEDKETASLMGINVNKIYIASFAMGSCLAGLAGGLLGTIYVVEPTMGLFPIIIAFMVVVVGGVGSFKGALMAALLVSTVEIISGIFVPQHFVIVLTYVLLIIAVWLQSVRVR